MPENIFVTNLFLEAGEQVALERTFLVDAILVSPSITWLVDAFVSTINTETFLVDVFISSGPTIFSAVDAFISLTQAETILVDANLLLIQFETFLVDAIILGTEYSLVDAIIVRIVHDFPLIGGLTDVHRHDIAPFDSPQSAPLNILVDAILDTEHFSFSFSDVHYQDIAHFITPPGTNIFVDAVLSGLKQKTFLVDAIIQPQPTIPASVDALLLGTKSETFDVDAIILGPPINETFLVDAVLFATLTKTFLVDVFLTLPVTRFMAVDALLPFPIQFENYNVDAFLSTIKIKTFLVDVVLNVTKRILVDAIIAPFNEIIDICSVQMECPPPPEEKTFLVDAILLANFDTDYRVDALLVAIVDETFLVDAVIVNIFNETFDVDAVIQEVFFENILVDAIILDPIKFKTFLADARIVYPGTNIDCVVDAILSPPGKTFLVDVFISIKRNENYLVDAHLVINARIEATTFIREDLNITSMIRVRERTQLP